MRNIILLIPNALTLANMFFGILAIFHAFDRNWSSVLFWMSMALLMDVLDGAVARLLKVDGELGKQLDSLADVVSFGVLPGITVFWLMRDQCEPLSAFQAYVPLAAFFLSLGTAYRLGKFNIDTRQGTSFIGLASPAQAIGTVGLAFWSNDIANLAWSMGLNPSYFYLLWIAAMIWAMTTERIQLPGFKSMRYASAKMSLAITAIGGLVLFYFFSLKSITPIILLYLVSGAILFRPNDDSAQAESVH